MKTYLKPGATEISELLRPVKVIKGILYVFMALIFLFIMAMVMPFDGFNAWFWITTASGGLMLLLTQAIRLLLEQKFNRQASKGRMVFYQGVVGERGEFWQRRKDGKGRIILDGEQVYIDPYDFGRVKPGDAFAYLEWEELGRKIDSAIGADSIQALKARRNLP
jgi:hypothetical protein